MRRCLRAQESFSAVPGSWRASWREPPLTRPVPRTTNYARLRDRDPKPSIHGKRSRASTRTCSRVWRERADPLDISMGCATTVLRTAPTHGPIPEGACRSPIGDLRCRRHLRDDASIPKVYLLGDARIDDRIQSRLATVGTDDDGGSTCEVRTCCQKGEPVPVSIGVGIPHGIRRHRHGADRGPEGVTSGHRLEAYQRTVVARHGSDEVPLNLAHAWLGDLGDRGEGSVEGARL